MKYDRLGVVLVNVVHEQQAEIEALQRSLEAEKAKTERRDAEIADMRGELALLKAAVCPILGDKACHD